MRPLLLKALKHSGCSLRNIFKWAFSLIPVDTKLKIVFTFIFNKCMALQIQNHAGQGLALLNEIKVGSPQEFNFANSKP